MTEMMEPMLELGGDVRALAPGVEAATPARPTAAAKAPRARAAGVVPAIVAAGPQRAWVVVVTHQKMEFVVKRELEDQARKGKLGEGFEVYLPLRLHDNGKGVTCPKPFLTGYVFASVTAQMADWRGVFGTRGVKGVLGGSRQGMRGLADWVVARIRAQEEGGFVKMGLAPDQVERVFEEGQKVKVDQLVEALFVERVDSRRALIVYSFFNGRDSRRIVDLRRLSESS